MTQLTHDLLSAYSAAVAYEAAVANSDLLIHRAFRLETARVRMRETRARLIDHLEKLEAMAMPPIAPSIAPSIGHNQGCD